MSDQDLKEALLKRIQDAKAKTSEFEAATRETEELRDLERKARIEENRARDLPHIQAAEEKHGKIGVIGTELGAIVVTRPNHLAYSRFTKKSTSKDGIDDRDVWALIKTCAVYPRLDEIDKITEEFPGVVGIIGSKIVELANGRIEETEGK